MNPLSTEKIKTRNDFISFIKNFRQDFKINRSSWENQDLESFLEALEAYSQDIEGYYKNNYPEIDSEKPDWRIFADILAGAKIYE